MRTFTFSEARRKLGTLLDMVEAEGEVRICRKDGQVFTIRPVEMEIIEAGRSPLDIPGVDLGISADEIVDVIREGREQA